MLPEWDIGIYLEPIWFGRLPRKIFLFLLSLKILVHVVVACVSCSDGPPLPPIRTQACPTKTECVAPLKIKMMGVDVTRLSKGHTRPRERHGSAGEGGAVEAGSGAAEAPAGADAVTAAKRNDSAAVRAARERFFGRKAAGGGGASKR